MFRRAFVLLAGTLALAACVDTTQPGGTQASGVAPLPLAAPSVSGAPVGGSIAILAPLTGANAERGKVLVQAAQLALSAEGSPRLDVRDTASTPAGAAAAAQAALAAGDGLLIGPLTAAETAAVAGPARAAGVAVLAFTNDASQAQPGVWPLGITAAQQVRRLVGSAMAQSKTRFAAVLPPGDFGTAMANALTQAAATAGSPAPSVHVHDGSNAGIASLMRDVSGYAERRGPIETKIKAARALHTAEGRKLAAELTKEPIPPPPFDALLLADTGEKLAWEASFLEYYDIAPPTVGGAWYAAPDPAARATFDADYQAKYSAPAPGLADFAFDAAAIARVLAQSGGFSVASLCRPEGYAGVDGVLALQPDGGVRRGLAVFEIQRGGATIVDAAPTTLAAPGI